MFGMAPRSKAAPRARSQQSAAAVGKDGEPLIVGRRVRLAKGQHGVVRWVGPTHFAAGVWIGVELDSCEGRNDGEVQGSRYFTCAPGHGVFVKCDGLNSIKGEGPGSTPSKDSVRDRRRPSLGGADGTPLARKGSHASLASENFGPSAASTAAWGAASESGSARKTPNKSRSAGSDDDQIIGRILASEAFSRILSATVDDRVRTEVAKREARTKADSEAMQNRMTRLEQGLDDAGGAMDDIASMVQMISETVEGGAPAEADLRDAAAGGGGDAGGGGRDDARVAELTKLLCTVHDMSSQAAELLRSERKQNQVRVKYLTERVQELEAKQRRAAPSPTPMEG